MRENSELYSQAEDKAWQQIQSRLDSVKRMFSTKELELVEVTYDGDSFVSRVDELPDEPKSSNPVEIEIRVAVEALYRIGRRP